MTREYSRLELPLSNTRMRPESASQLGLCWVIVMPSASGRPLLHQKMLSNIAEISARGARTIVIAEQGDEQAAAAASDLAERLRDILDENPS